MRDAQTDHGQPLLQVHLLLPGEGELVQKKHHLNDHVDDDDGDHDDHVDNDDEEDCDDYHQHMSRMMMIML